MLLTLAVLLVPVTTASAAECTRAVEQGRTFEDPVGDSGNAPDLGIVWVDVDDDCVVSITFALDGNRLLASDALSVTVDDRVFNARGRREGAHLIVFETTVEALGLRPGRAIPHLVRQPLRQRRRRDGHVRAQGRLRRGPGRADHRSRQARPHAHLRDGRAGPVAARRPRDQARHASARTRCAAPTPATGSPAAPAPRPRPRSAFSAGRTGGSSPSASAADGRRPPPARPPSSSGRR